MERFLEYFVPERYKLDLSIDKFAKTISGTVEVIGKALAQTVKFHAVELVIDEVEIDGKKADFENKDGVLTLFKVPRSASCIRIVYHGSLNENMEGAYLSTYEYRGKTETIVTTQFESHYAREAFPCIDEPAAKAVFELAISIPEDSEDIILANMPILDVVKNTTIFEPTPRMSTYLLAWVIGKFHGKTITNNHGVEITTYCALNQDIDAVDFANEIAARSLEYYDDNFGVPYPLKRCLQVAIPDFEAGAMENWGLVTYRESMLLVGNNATLGTKKSVALTVAHELSHQWFGDLVTMKWWDDLWLNESFASIMEYYAVDFIHPEYKIFENFFCGDALSALKRDAIMGVQSVHQDVKDPAEIATLFDPSIVYAKGARLMLMVIRAMGWNRFCLGMKDYFEKFKYSNTVGDDLWNALTPHAEFDVKAMMHSFIDQPGYPVVTNTGVDFDSFDQKRFLLEGEMKESNWPLPGILEDMSGHYVLNLSEKEFEERLERFDELGLEERLRLLIDRDLLAKTGLVESASLLPLVLKFKNESSAAVWNILLMIVGGMKVFFEPDSQEEKKYKEFVCDLVTPKLSEIGLKTREGDVENILRLRSILLALNFYGENRDYLAKLAEMYSSDYGELDSEIRSDILDAKAFLDADVIDDYMKTYQEIADPEIKYDLLFAMTVTKNKNRLHEVMELLNRTDVVKPQDQFYLFLYLFRNTMVKKEIFEWLTNNWDYVKNLAGDKSLDNYPRYTAVSVRTKEEYEMWRRFFGKFAKDPALARTVEMGENEINARLGLISEDGEAVLKWVMEY